MASTPTMPVIPLVNPTATNLQQQLGAAGASTAASRRTADTKATSKPKPPARAKPKPRKVPDGVVGGHYTIQVSSWNTAKKAQRVKQSLDGLGYDTYIQRVWIEELNAVWWRVRLGDFSDVQEARRVKDELSGQFADIWVDNMRKEMVETE